MCSPLPICTRRPGDELRGVLWTIRSHVHCLKRKIFSIIQQKLCAVTAITDLILPEKPYRNWMNLMRRSCYDIRLQSRLGTIRFPPFQVNNTLSVWEHLLEHCGGKTRMTWVLCLKVKGMIYARDRKPYQTMVWNNS